jgi:hypothetical protein
LFRQPFFNLPEEFKEEENNFWLFFRLEKRKLKVAVGGKENRKNF